MTKSERRMVSENVTQAAIRLSIARTGFNVAKRRWIRNAEIDQNFSMGSGTPQDAAMMTAAHKRRDDAELAYTIALHAHQRACGQRI